MKSSANKVTIKPYNKSYDNQLLKLSVSDQQLPYIGAVKEILDEKEEGFHYKIILYNDISVGFFNIDENYGERYDFAERGDLGFRAFFIDKQYQGMGIAGATMQQLKSHLNSQFPQKKTVLLTVNCRNEIAYKLYTKYGFENTGKLYHGGKSGPQHILKMDL